MTEMKGLTVQNWLSNLAPSTQLVQGNYFKNFMNWNMLHGGKFKDYTPDQLIEYQAEKRDYELLDKLIKPYVRQAKGTFNTKNSRYTNIRSFFAHNRAELPKDKQFKIRPEYEPIRGSLTVNEIRLALLSCNSVYQAVFFSMFQSAMDQETFCYWNANGWDSLHEQLDQDIIQIELPGRKSYKNIAPYYSFIGRDAIKAIKEWLELRKKKVREGKIPEDSKVIFCDKYGKAMNKRTMREYWLSHLRKIGLAPLNIVGKRQTKTGKGLHEMRDVFRSLWSKSSASHIVCEYSMGHKIDKLEYDKSFRDVEFYRSEYALAEPFFNLMSAGEAFGRVEKKELDQLRIEQQNKIEDLENQITDIMAILRKPTTIDALYDDHQADGIKNKVLEKLYHDMIKNKDLEQLYHDIIKNKDTKTPEGS